MASTKKTTTKNAEKTTSVVEPNNNIEKLEEELRATKEQNAQIMSALQTLLNKVGELETANKELQEAQAEKEVAVSKETISEAVAAPVETVKEEPAKKRNIRREYVTIVHLLENYPDISTHIELTGCTIDFHTLGEERSLTWSQFEELAGKFKNLFDLDVIALSEEDSDLVARYNLKSLQDNTLNRFYLENLPNMRTEDLEDLYNKLSTTHKNFIIGYWQRKFLEGDVRFKDRRKIELLNSLSNESMQNIILELNEESKRRK